MNSHRFYEEALKIQKEAVKWRRYLHKNPEIGLDLPNTSSFVIKKLEEFGLKPETIAPSSIIVYIGRKENNNGKCFLLRADMDALRMDETSGEEFSSCNGNCHSCGHDIHTTILLVAAKILKEHENEIPGKIKLMFQPGEEIGKGALAMIDKGLLNDVCAAMAFHVFQGAYAGDFRYTIGCSTAAIDNFVIRVKGKQSHGAFPNMGASAINIGCHIYLALQELVAREVSPLDQVVIAVGAFEAGDISGTVNTMVGDAVLDGCMRTVDNEVRDRMIERMKEIVKLTARAFRGEATLEIPTSCPDTFNNAELTERLVKSISTCAPNVTIKTQTGLMGSEDFSFISKQVPSSFIILGAQIRGEEYCPNHNPSIRFDENSIPYGAAAFVQCALDFVKDQNK